jgi:hypothetical protein
LSLDSAEKRALQNRKVAGGDFSGIIAAGIDDEITAVQNISDRLATTATRGISQQMETMGCRISLGCAMKGTAFTRV